MYPRLRRNLTTLRDRQERCLNALLEELESVLARHGEATFAARVRGTLDADGDMLREFLVSNDLWGGAGSIADQAGVGAGREVRRAIEDVLERLGTEQLRRGPLNPRTRMWTEAFSTRRGDER